ncbi:MAG: AbrB/MazE/SpoVT family DNA-binding domain-containing protein [Bradyrhizobium sp.]|nr:MAG: AbrB/MazE/SpoVT family DNA-binding domain-containing protein [Bradyrhizobium sp.]
MRTTIAKWGNSLALRIPAAVVEQTKLGEGATVEIAADGVGFRVTPSPPRYTLAELMEGFESDEGVEWGPPRGAEVW